MGGGDVSRPDDIPQDVWDAAGYSVTAAPVYTGILHENVARAMMAERERCAKVAREYIFTDLAKYHSNQAVAGNATMNVAAMILGALPIVIRKDSP
jgi:hypothetical protein